MTVLYIIDYVTQGGAIHSFMEMVTELRKMGVFPIVITSKKDTINEILDNEGIENLVVGHKTVLRPFSYKSIKWPYVYFKGLCGFYLSERNALKRISKTLGDYNIDIIHTNSARNDIGCYISQSYKIPHVMHIREFGDADFNCISFRRNLIDFFNKHTDKFISISDAVKEHWIKRGLDPLKTETVYNGISYEDITVSSKEDKHSSFKMIFAGGVFPTKGQHLAVEALGKLPQDVLDHVSLDVAGWYDESYVSEMKECAKRGRYDSQIKFLGSVSNLHEKLGEYQIGLMCSKAEGFGRVTAEYMHAQLGVIASDSGANPELIQDGENGLLFKSGDAKSLAECILKLYYDRELLIRLSHAAKKKATAVYTQKKNAENIYKIYQEILNK